MARNKCMSNVLTQTLICNRLLSKGKFKISILSKGKFIITVCPKANLYSSFFLSKDNLLINVYIKRFSSNDNL